ncbi:MAG TPA: dethiobiotin synthase [archaeon]|nr:dethiobiotin synthase [archaeon]
MALKGFFVTGTGTGVGKTAVAAALVWLMNNKGIKTTPFKPVETGVTPDKGGDLLVCLETAGLSPGPRELELMRPYRFSLPASPHLAAEDAGQEIDLDRIESAARNLASSYKALIVESAGGLLVPLTRRVTTLHLAQALGLPLIVVARAGLGTINHSLLTLEAAGNAGLRVAAVVLNRPEPEKPSECLSKLERDNRRVIQEFSGISVWEALPHIPGAGKKPESTRILAVHLVAAGAESLISQAFKNLMQDRSEDGKA